MRISRSRRALADAIPVGWPSSQSRARSGGRALAAWVGGPASHKQNGAFHLRSPSPSASSTSPLSRPHRGHQGCVPSEIARPSRRVLVSGGLSRGMKLVCNCGVRPVRWARHGRAERGASAPSAAVPYAHPPRLPRAWRRADVELGQLAALLAVPSLSARDLLACATLRRSEALSQSARVRPARRAWRRPWPSSNSCCDPRPPDAAASTVLARGRAQQPSCARDAETGVSEPENSRPGRTWCAVAAFCCRFDG